MPPRSPGRVLAPLALAAFAIAFLVVVAASGGGEDGGDRERAPSTTRPVARRTTTTPPRRPASRPRFYVVRRGDILQTIADRTGVSVERLRELNPDLDPRALVAGQRIRLRP